MPRVVVFDAFGGPEVLQVVDRPAPDPGPGEVRIRVEAIGLNPLDAMMRSGRSPGAVSLPSRLGIEATGVVDARGAGVTGCAVGSPVIVAALPDAGARGVYADLTVLPAAAVIPRPPGLDVTRAAAVWVAFATAYGSLVELAGAGPGDRVVIAGASGSVGRAAIQLADALGAVPVAVTRESAKTDELLAAGAAHVIGTNRDDLVSAVGRLTAGRGADIAVDLVRGPGQQQLVRSLRPGGTLVAAGYLDPRPTPPPVPGSARLLDYRGWDHLLDPDELARTSSMLSTLVERGAIEPAVDTVFALDDVVAAHRRFDRGLHDGRKIVITTGD